ncbi:MAG: PAS-domain containing protein [Sneathiella sp.]|nr:PAS-domain containing protein [Sneathiella sp.]
MNNRIFKPTIAKKLFIYLMLVSVIPLTVVGIASYELSTAAIIQQAKISAQKEILYRRDILDLHLEKTENLISGISGVEEIINAMSDNQRTTNIYTKLAIQARIGYILNGYLSLDGLISIDIYTVSGEQYHVGETLGSPLISETKKKRLFADTLASGRFIYWAGVEDNINKDSPRKKVLTAASIFTDVDVDTLEQTPIALLVLNYDVHAFSRSLLNSEGIDQTRFIITDQKNRIIHHPDTSLIGSTASLEIMPFILEDAFEGHIKMGPYDMMVNSTHFKRNDWHMIRLEPLASITKPSEGIGTFTLSLLAFSFVIVSFVAYLYSRTVVTPIRRVTDAFKAFEKGNLNPNSRIATVGTDEIAELTKWYNSFLEVVCLQQVAQAALKNSEDRFKDFAEASSDWLWETDENHIFTFITDKLFDALTFDRDNIIGHSRLELLKRTPGNYWKHARADHLADLKAYKSFRIVYPIIDLSGQAYTIQTNGKPFFDKNGKFLGYRGSATDITKQVEAEQSLLDINKRLEQNVLERTSALQSERDRAEHLVAAIDTLTEAVSIYDPDDRLLFYNKRFLEFNSEIEGVIKKGAFFREILTALVHNKVFPDAIGDEEAWINHRMEMHVNPKGSFEQVQENDVWLLIHEQRLPDGGYAILAADITERKQFEDQIRKAQKMEAIGQITGGIAHDFNNILGIIRGNLELLSEVIPSEDAHPFLKNAEKGVDRAADITRKLLGFSRKGAKQINAVNINKYIENMQELVAKSLTAYIAVETQLDKNLWPVAIDTGDFEDAMLNLSINARDAMLDGGTLLIETKNKTLDKDYLKHHSTCEAGDYVMVTVNDTGTGMDNATQEKVFEPFFTTKEPGKGTGLGLSMVYGFVQRSHGHLSIYSEVGQGTSIQMFFPRVSNNKSAKTLIEEVTAILPTGKETILIVDDEQGLRDVAVLHLQALGYDTVVADCGEAALKIIETRDDIELLFSDVVMPGKLDGYQLAKHVHSSYPDLKILLTSGFVKTSEDAKHNNNEYMANLSKKVLRKPYNKTELANSVRNTLRNGFS